MSTSNSSSLRKKAAREAANLLYRGVEKEYKQAKMKAEKTLGAHFLPTNLEVARELDKIAEQYEGATRNERLIRMRRQALRLMETLKLYNPVLVGSVWRGTIHHESDIDIVVYHEEPNKILEVMKQTDLKVIRSEWITITKEGTKKTSLHIYLQLPTKDKAEVVVRSPREARQKQRCEIYGDIITGLRIQKLEKLLQENPTQRFVPF